MYKVEKALLDVLEEPPKVMEETQDEYLIRIVRSAALVEDSVWDRLPEDAQDWVNGNIDRLNEHESPQTFQDFFGLTDEEASYAVDPEEARLAALAAHEKPKSKKNDPRRKFSKRRPPGRKPHPEATGGSARLMEVYLENPDASIEEVHAKLIREGYTMSRTTVISVRAIFRAALKVLARHGYLDTNKYYFGVINQ